MNYKLIDQIVVNDCDTPEDTVKIEYFDDTVISVTVSEGTSFATAILHGASARKLLDFLKRFYE